MWIRTKTGLTNLGLIRHAVENTEAGTIDLYGEFGNSLGVLPASLLDALHIKLQELGGVLDARADAPLCIQADNAQSVNDFAQAAQVGINTNPVAPQTFAEASHYVNTGQTSPPPPQAQVQPEPKTFLAPAPLPPSQQPDPPRQPPPPSNTPDHFASQPRIDDPELARASALRQEVDATFGTDHVKAGTENQFLFELQTRVLVEIENLPENVKGNFVAGINKSDMGLSIDVSKPIDRKIFSENNCNRIIKSIDSAREAGRIPPLSEAAQRRIVTECDPFEDQ